MAEALTELEDRLCSGCGQRRDLAWNPDTEGWWDIHEAVCEACAAIDREQKKTKDPTPGFKPIVTLSEGYTPDTRAVEA